MKVLLVAINAKYIHSNLAVYSLKEYAQNYLKEKSNEILTKTIKNVDNNTSYNTGIGTPIEISIAEYTINNLTEDVVCDIYKEQPDIIAFSTYIWNVDYVIRVADTLKKIMPQAAIWAGGPEVAYRPEQFLKENSFFDMIMCGEGELIFSQAVLDYYRTGICESIISSHEVLAMDELPFIYSDMKEFEHRIIYYETSRGCPFSCSYCLSSVDKLTRFRSIGLVLQELGFFLENKVPLVKFVDRTLYLLRTRKTA